MLATRDSLLKFLEGQLVTPGLPVKANPDKPLALNALNVTFLSTVPAMRVNPGRYELSVSLDLLVSGDAQMSAERKAEKLKRAVDVALAVQVTPKLDYTDPVFPTETGTALYWQLWHPWTRVPDPESLYEHWSRTMSVWWSEEKRI